MEGETMANLHLYFLNEEEYNKANDFFQYESEFTPMDSNDEFMCYIFEEESNIDALEMFLTDELAENDFCNFYFTAE